MIQKSPRNPTREELLLIIEDETRWSGNATINHIRLRLGLAFGWHSEPTFDQVNKLIGKLIAEDLVTKDGACHNGSHFALTFKGKRKLANLRRSHAKAA